MQKDSRSPTLVQLIIHYAMGAVLGALLALAMIFTHKDIFQFILSSSSPLLDTMMFVGVLSFAIGTGASMTGFIFSAIELDALEAKRQTNRIKQRQGPR
jgi:predicted alpha/beta superfamily hydrolase